MNLAALARRFTGKAALALALGMTACQKDDPVAPPPTIPRTNITVFSPLQNPLQVPVGSTVVTSAAANNSVQSVQLRLERNNVLYAQDPVYRSSSTVIDSAQNIAQGATVISYIARVQSGAREDTTTRTIVGVPVNQPVVNTCTTFMSYGYQGHLTRLCIQVTNGQADSVVLRNTGTGRRTLATNTAAFTLDSMFLQRGLQIMDTYVAGQLNRSDTTFIGRVPEPTTTQRNYTVQLGQMLSIQVNPTDTDNMQSRFSPQTIELDVTACGFTYPRATLQNPAQSWLVQRTFNQPGDVAGQCSYRLEYRVPNGPFQRVVVPYAGTVTVQ